MASRIRLCCLLATLAVTRLIFGQPQANSPWPRFHGNNLNTGVGVGAGANGTQKWRFPMGFVQSCPAIGADGTVYIGSQNEVMYALDPLTGAKKWSFAADGNITDSAAIGADGTVYFGSEFSFYALDGATGAVKWSFVPTGPFGRFPSPAIGSDGTVYVIAPTTAQTSQGSTPSATVFALDGADGSVKWSYAAENETEPIAAPALSSSGVLYFTLWDVSNVQETTSFLYALDGSTGAKIYEDTLTPPQGLSPNACSWGSPTLGPDGTIYVPGPGGVDALVGSTGAVRWQYFEDNCGSYGSCALGAGGLLYIGMGDDNVVALEAASGQKAWSFASGNEVLASVALAADGTVYATSTDDNLYALNGQTGAKIWSFTDTSSDGIGIYGSPAIGADGTVYFGGLSYVYAIASPALSKFYASPSTLNGNSIATGVVQLTTFGLSALNVSLSSKNAAVVVPASVTVPARSTGVSFQIKTSSVSVQTVATLTASYGNEQEQTAVTVDPAPALTGFSINNTSPFMTYQATGTVTLASAPVSEVILHASSSNSFVTISSQPVVAAGHTAATFLLTANPILGPHPQPVTISVNLGTTTLADTVQVQPIVPISASISPSVLHAGESGTLTINMAEAADVESYPVTISNGSPSLLNAPSTATITPHTHSASVTVAAASSVSGSHPVTIEATVAGKAVSAEVTVEP